MGVFGWLNFKEGLPLWWSFKLNKGTVQQKEEIFESIARTRVNLLQGWTKDRWASLDTRAYEILNIAPNYLNQYLVESKNKSTYFTELFYLTKILKYLHQVFQHILGQAIKIHKYMKKL